MSWLSGLFKQKEVKLEPDRESWQMGTGKGLSDWVQKYMGQYEPGKEYGGKFAAPMAEGEKAGQGWLMKYLNTQGPGENYGLAANELKKTMTGEYDPYASPYYKSLREGAGNELEDTIDVMRRGQGARGTYFQDTSMREENKMRQRSLNTLMNILGGMAETERGRRFEGIDKAMGLEQYEQGIPVQKAQAGMTLGALPRLIEQADLESQYQDFTRKQQELSGVMGQAHQLFSTPMNYGVKGYKAPSAFERIMQTVGPLAGQFLGSMSGGSKAMAGGGKNYLTY